MARMKERALRAGARCASRSARRPYRTLDRLTPDGLDVRRGQANGAAPWSGRRFARTILEDRAPEIHQLGRLAEPPIEQRFCVIVLPAPALMQVLEVEPAFLSEVAPFLGCLVEPAQSFPVVHEGPRNRRMSAPPDAVPRP